MSDTPLPEPLIQYRTTFATIIGYTTNQMHAHAAAVSAERDAEIDGLQRRIRLLEQMVCDAAYTLEGARIWGGMDWAYNPLHPSKYRPMLDCLNKERERINAAREALGDKTPNDRANLTKGAQQMTERNETAQPAPLGQVERGVGRPVPERNIVCEMERALARLATGEAMTEGELWSWVRSVMSQGADIRTDYDMGVHKGYEAYSARLDMAAAERADQLLARLKMPNLSLSANQSDNPITDTKGRK